MAGLWQEVANRLAGGANEARANYGSMAAAVPTGGGRSVFVSEESSLQNAAVLRCVSIISGTLAGLPLHVYRRVGEGKERADNTPLGRTLAEPNTYQTSFKWRETSWQWALLYGNAVSKIVRNGRGDPVGLKPMEPWNLTFLEQIDSPDVVYRYWNPATRQTENYGAWEVLHLRGLTSDGRIGFSVIENLMYQSVGLALTLQEMATNFYENGSMLSGVVSPGKTVNPATRDAFMKAWNTMHQGPANAGRVALLDFNDKYSPITVPPEQAQFLESRQYSVLEIARAFGVPPHLIGAPDSQSYASAEQNNLEFVQYTLLPWVRNLEDEIWRSLILAEQRPRLFAEHNLSGLLRGDTKSRFESYAVAVQNGWMSRNEVRSLESMNQEEGLDEFLAPLNMTTAPALAAEAENTIEGKDDGGNDPQAETVPPAPTPAARGRQWSSRELAGLTPSFDFDWRDSSGHDERAEFDESESEGPDEPLSDAQTATRRERQGLFGTFDGLWTDSADRLVKREVADLRRKLASVRDQADAVVILRAWLEEFYRELQPKIPAYFRPVLAASVKAARGSVARELGSKAPAQDTFAEFIEAYLTNLATAWVLGSQGQLNALLDMEEGALDAVSQRVDEWEEKRPGKTGNQQAVDSINAATLASYGAMGVAATIWASRGQSCKFCRRMHGRRVAVGQPFIEDGMIDGGDGEAMRVYGSKKHPQLHQACDCTLVAA